jgi:hypothetical protein
MEHKAACDTSFLFDQELDQERFYNRWVVAAREVMERGCEVFVDENWGQAYGVEGSVLHHETELPFKELRTFLVNALPKMVPVANPLCDGRAVAKHCFCLRDGDELEEQVICDAEEVTVFYGYLGARYRRFWRELLSHFAESEEVFDRFIPVAFWQLEFGPQARGKWGDTGYAFFDIQLSLVEHLTYLEDMAIADWNQSAHHDGEFARTATSRGVELSRDERAAGNRAYPNLNGVAIQCRHHTKLTPRGEARSAHHGGRIYFAVENRTHVFVGKVCEHD